MPRTRLRLGQKSNRAPPRLPTHFRYSYVPKLVHRAQKLIPTDFSLNAASTLLANRTHFNGGAGVEPPPHAGVDAPVHAPLDAGVHASPDAPAHAGVNALPHAPLHSPVDAGVHALLHAPPQTPPHAPLDAPLHAGVDARVDAPLVSVVTPLRLGGVSPLRFPVSPSLRRGGTPLLCCLLDNHLLRRPILARLRKYGDVAHVFRHHCRASQVVFPPGYRLPGSSLLPFTTGSSEESLYSFGFELSLETRVRGSRFSQRLGIASLRRPAQAFDGHGKLRAKSLPSRAGVDRHRVMRGLEG
jgi:hypothetical protein